MHIGLVAFCVALDAFMSVASVVVSSVGYHSFVYGHVGNLEKMLQLGGALAIAYLLISALKHGYRIGYLSGRRGLMTDSLLAWTSAAIAFVSISFLAKEIEGFSRGAVIVTFLLGIPVLAMTRVFCGWLVQRAIKTGRIAAQRVIVIGKSSEIARFMRRQQSSGAGFEVIDTVHLEPQYGDSKGANADADNAEQIRRAVTRTRQLAPDSVFIALPWSDSEKINACVRAFLEVPVAIHLAPEQILERFTKPRIARTGGISSLELVPTPLSNLEVGAKRVLDFVSAAVLLTLLAPLFALIALAIKLDSKGPVFFFQRRFGFNQKSFWIVKFRTMMAMEDGEVFKQAKVNDPRITYVGAILRRCNLDELPQLINVLQGNMSLVGPRPHALAHDRKFQDIIKLYARRHNVRPGITGWAQVNGYRGETDTLDKMEKRVNFDLWYIDNWTLWLDLKILLRTVFSPTAYRNAR
jgi:Undecaprenyl-phosphate glucose phosphotransferase